MRSPHRQVAGLICLWVPGMWLGTSKCLWQTKSKKFSFYCLCFSKSLLPVSWSELILIRAKFSILKRLGTVSFLSFHGHATSHLTNLSPEGSGNVMDSLVHLIPLNPSILPWERELLHQNPLLRKYPDLESLLDKALLGRDHDLLPVTPPPKLV